MSEGRNAVKILGGKPTRKRPLGIPRSKQEEDIRMDLEEISTNRRNWVDLALDMRAFLNAALNFWVSVSNGISQQVKPTGNRPLGKRRHRWEDNIRMFPKEIGINTRNWFYSIQDRDYSRALANAAFNLRFP